MEKTLGCTCGGAVEERGDVRYYGKGRAVVKDDGHREWVGDTWTTPIETLEPDDPPFHCVACGMQFALDELVPLTVEQEQDAWDDGALTGPRPPICAA